VKKCFFSYKTHLLLSQLIDKLCKEHNTAVLATGVNPGFLMDALPLFLTSVCKQITSIKVERHQNAAIRRLPFQKKIGAGLTLEEFTKRVKTLEIRHVGFEQSAYAIAHYLGWKLDSYTETVDPVIAETKVTSPFLTVEQGDCSGVRQIAHGYKDGKAVITLEMEAYLGHAHPHDKIIINGEPNINSVIEGGVNGDVATCSIIVNAIDSLLKSPTGFRTMADIPLTHYCS